jgi:very-short-patch-repair endonuclease
MTGVPRKSTGADTLAMDQIEELMALQAGVVSRRQVLAAGFGDHDIRRLLRRREWALVHDGVYVGHTGPLTWLQRAWAAVLFAWPASLCHRSALRAVDGPGRRDHDDDAPIHVAVHRDRSVRAPAGIRVFRLADLEAKTQWNSSPPRLRIEEAVLDVAAGATTDFEAISVLADAVQSRRTTVDRLLGALRGRSRIRRRRLLEAVLADVRAGACSALEHAYLTRVERPHGLPRATRQLRASSENPVYRDVVYQAQGLVVELDGRTFDDNARARDRDLDRDLEVAVDGLTTIRIGWGQAVGRPCATAEKIGRILDRLGWSGTPTTCPQCGQR